MKLTKIALVALTTLAFTATACDKKEEAKKDEKAADAKKDEKTDEKKEEEAK